MDNNRIRFAVEGEKIFDYENSRYIPIKGVHKTKQGLEFDLQEVAKCIRENRFIEEALVGYAEHASDQGQELQDLRAQMEVKELRLAESESTVESLQKEIAELQGKLQAKPDTQSAPPAPPEGTQKPPAAQGEAGQPA